MNFAKTIRSVSVAFALCVLGSAAQAGSAPVVTTAMGVCNATLMQFVDTPAAVVYGSNGIYQVPLPIANLDVGNCRHLYFEIGTTTATSVQVNMGKIGGQSLSETVYSSLQIGHIQSLEVKGPQAMVMLKGPPNTKDSVQMWFYLTN